MLGSGGFHQTTPMQGSTLASCVMSTASSSGKLFTSKASEFRGAYEKQSADSGLMLFAAGRPGRDSGRTLQLEGVLPIALGGCPLEAGSGPTRHGRRPDSLSTAIFQSKSERQRKGFARVRRCGNAGLSETGSA